MPQKINPLINYIFIGLKKKIKECFKVDAHITTDEQIRSILYSGSIKEYPIAFLKLTNGTFYDEGIRANKAGAQSGILGKIQEDNTAIKLSAIPINLTVEFNYITDNFEEVLDFFGAWFHTCLKNRLNFALTYYDIDFDTVVLLDDNLAIPTKEDLKSDIPDFFQYNGTLNIYTYITNEDSRDIQQVPLITTINTQFVTAKSE